MSAMPGRAGKRSTIASIAGQPGPPPSAATRSGASAGSPVGSEISDMSRPGGLRRHHHRPDGVARRLVGSGRIVVALATALERERLFAFVIQQATLEVPHRFEGLAGAGLERRR